MATASCAAHQAFNGVFEGLFLTGVHPRLHCRVTGKFAPSQPDSGAPHLITERLFVQVVESRGRLERAAFHSDRNRPVRRIQYVQKQTDAHRPNENATHRARLDQADTSAAFDACGRKAKENAATETTANKGGSTPRRESENNAAEFPAETAAGPQGPGTGRLSIISFWSRFPDRDCEGTIARAPSSGVRPFRRRCIFSSDAWKAVHGHPWSRNGLQGRRIC